MMDFCTSGGTACVSVLLQLFSLSPFVFLLLCVSDSLSLSNGNTASGSLNQQL